MALQLLRNLPADHVDLIMTSAISFGVISAPPGTQRPHQVLTALAQRLGTGLLLRNQTADPAGYRYRPIEGPLDVRDVLKASHAAQFAYRDTRHWIGSNEQRVVDGVAKAAAMRTPGYELSPWIWTRPAEEAIGHAPACTWFPDGLENVEWIDDVDDFAHRWERARVVVLTPAALEQLPALPARPRVYIVVGADQAAAAILDAHQHRVESVLIWPEAAGWLKLQVLN